MMENSEFLPSCKGKSVILEFKFMRLGEPVDAPTSQIYFSPPNKFRIQARPQVGSVDYAPPKAK